MPYQLNSFVTPPFAGYRLGTLDLQPHRGRGDDAADRHAVLSGRHFRIRHSDGIGLNFEYGPTTHMQAAVCHVLRRLGPGFAVARLRRHSSAGRRFSRPPYRPHRRARTPGTSLMQYFRGPVSARTVEFPAPGFRRRRVVFWPTSATPKWVKWLVTHSPKGSLGAVAIRWLRSVGSSSIFDQSPPPWRLCWL